MQRNPISLLGTMLSFLAVCSASPVSAQQEGQTVNASPPLTCFTAPADLRPLPPADYPWDAPACGVARAKWKRAHTKIVAQTVAVDPAPLFSSSTILLSSGPAAPTSQVDGKGLAFVTNGLPRRPANAQPVWLPKGTLFPVHTMQSYSTFEALPYGKLRFELDQDVVVNGFLVAMKGDTAEGSFPNVKTGRNFFVVTISGSLFEISVDTVYNFCGDKVDVNFDRTEYRKNRLGTFGTADMDQHITRGQGYVSFTSHPQTVCGVPTTDVNSPVPSTALYPTTH